QANLSSTSSSNCVQQFHLYFGAKPRDERVCECTFLVPKISVTAVSTAAFDSTCTKGGGSGEIVNILPNARVRLASPMRPLQSDVEQRGTRIFELVDEHSDRVFSKAGIYQRLMALSMHDERFKTQLFRFVAVLPSLRTSREIIQHLQEYFRDA